MRILVAPLDWGLGHASRCIPIVEALLAAQMEPVIAAQGQGKALLQLHFRELEFIDLPGFEASYPAGSGMTWHLLKRLPALLHAIWQEHRLLDVAIDRYHLQGVISDNRYGLWSRKVTSVFVTHQLQIKAGVFSRGINAINHWFMGKFAHCWVPDAAGEASLAGELSQGQGVQRIGFLSRFSSNGGEVSGFSGSGAATALNAHVDFLGVVSGPEPQRGLFEGLLQLLFERLDGSAVLLTGQPSVLGQQGQGHAQVPPLRRGVLTPLPHCSDADFAGFARQARFVFSRPGYSTLMDFCCLGIQAKCIFVPTPGQPEQAYLGRLMQEKGIGLCVTQEELETYVAAPEELLRLASGFAGFDGSLGAWHHGGQLRTAIEKAFGGTA